MAEADKLTRRLAQARQRIEEGRQVIADAHRVIAAEMPRIAAARPRGELNKALWDCQRALGHRPHHFSQAGQDAFLDERVFKGRTGGTFVEIGGYDGVTGSNCLFFELMRGWSGLMIEPSPTQFALAAARRRCTCLQVALAASEGEAEFLDIQAGYSQMSGLVETYDPGLRQTVEADPRHKGEVIRVPTRPLAALLDEQGLSEVDYISLDVEGAEMAVLETFPFERFRVTAWTVENNLGSTEVPELMKARGYDRIEALGVDDVYLLRG